MLGAEKLASEACRLYHVAEWRAKNTEEDNALQLLLLRQTRWAIYGRLALPSSMSQADSVNEEWESGKARPPSPWTLWLV